MAFPVPFDAWVGLVDTEGNEVAAAGYRRMLFTFAWAVDGKTMANTTTQEWPIPREAWGAIEYVQLWDSLAGGELYAAGSTIPTLFTLSIGLYDVPRIRASGIVMRFGPQTRPYGVGLYGTGLYSAYASPVPRPYSVGPYGVGPFGFYRSLVPVTGWEALLEVVFSQPAYLAAPSSSWTPGPFTALDR
jgi:hypothetical protein